MIQQTNLERLSMDERHNELIRAEYTADNNEYSVSHPDALTPDSPNASGKEKGKGTGTPMGYNTLPETKNTNSPINYSTINTGNGGGTVDIKKRNEAFVKNLFSATNEYSKNSVDTSANIADGQIVINW